MLGSPICDCGNFYNKCSSCEDNQKLVYLAGPMTGLKYEDCIVWRKQVCESFPINIKGISPVRDYEDLRGKVLEKFGGGRPLNSSKAVYQRDSYDVRRCDAMLVNLLGSEIVSIGTCVEIGWATALQKPTVVVMDKGNIHDHPLISEAVGFICHSLEDGVHMISSILRHGN